MPDVQIDQALHGVYSLLDELQADVRIKKYLETIKATQNPLAQERKDLSARVHDLVINLQERLRDAIGEQPLRGCPNIFMPKQPLWAWNVRKIDKKDRLRLATYRPGQESNNITTALVLLHESEFAIVEVAGYNNNNDRRHRNTGYFDRYQYDILELEAEDLRIEDLVPCIETVIEACASHIQRSQKTAAETARVKTVFDALTATLANIGPAPTSE